MELLSLGFLLLSLGSAIWLLATRGWLRMAGFTAGCVWYAYGHLQLSGLISTLAFCAAGYGCAVAARRGRAALTAAVALLTVAFVYMRGYSFVPSDWRAELLATAGLSFLFFKILHVVIDSGGGTLGKLSPWAYLNYCLNFTTFLLGPIQRYQDFQRQWSGEEQAIEPGFEAHVDAVNRILRGLVKKFVVAEYLAGIVVSPGAELDGLSTGTILLSTYGFYFLLYFDFSGYCDVVIGVGQLIGVRPPENFRLPFLSANVADFWLRVHRSLTLWLTDYVFNPTFAGLLRRRVGTQKAMALALLVTMAVSGLWHGTTVNYLLFGLTHGLYLVVFRAFEHLATQRFGRDRFRKLRAKTWWKVLGVVLTFNFTAWAFLFWHPIGSLAERFL